MTFHLEIKTFSLARLGIVAMMSTSSIRFCLSPDNIQPLYQLQAEHPVAPISTHRIRPWITGVLLSSPSIQVKQRDVTC